MKSAAASVLICLSILLFPRSGWSGDGTTVTACPGTKRALVLSGGGIRGAYQVGAIWYLVHILGCDFSHFVGASTGAVTAAFLSQASGKEDLRTLVDMLVENYKGLEDSSDIVEAHFLGSLRVFLPYWLAGTDGIYNLEPLALKLSQQIDPKRVKNLLVPAVSLQAGRIADQKPDSILDYVIGSASIPLVIDPKQVRFWVPAVPTRLQGDTLIVSTVSAPGMPDPDCQVRLDNSWLLSCQHLRSERNQETLRWDTTLMLLSPSETEKLALYELITRSEAVLRELSDNRSPRSTVELKKQADQGLVEFTTYHQIVDGGVTDNIPLKDALSLPADTLFVLTSSSLSFSETEGTNEQVWGGQAILETAFNRLWDSYQGQALASYLIFPMLKTHVNSMNAWAQAVLEWRRELERVLGRSGLEKLEASMTNKFPTQVSSGSIHVPQMFMIGPRRKLILGALDVRPDAIRKALYHGCAVAKRTITAASKFGDVFLLPVPPNAGADDKDFEESMCNPLKS